jgi:diguanylate cyclase (GGDEF)-like protein
MQQTTEWLVHSRHDYANCHSFPTASAGDADLVYASDTPIEITAETMDDIVRILFVEDTEEDVALARRELDRDGLSFTWRRVTTESGLWRALLEFRPDVVLCDHTMPRFSGRNALIVIRQLYPSTPCLFVCDTTGEDVAITSLNDGFVDYLLKSNLRRLGPAVRHALADARERTRSQAVEAKLDRLVHYDTVTGLPNLGRIEDMFGRSIECARRYGQVVAVVTVNLDAFRLVEEGFGRGIGDEVLRSMGDTVTASVKDLTAVARVGADEFLVILDNLGQPGDARAPTQKILDAIAVPRNIGGQDLRITASAGVAVYPDDGSDFASLLLKSSAATHEVKVSSRGQLQFYSGDVTRRAQRRLRLETSLRRAIQDHELDLHYQAQFEIRSGHACGVEALARWTPPGMEAIAPSIFIPLAEQTGLIGTLGAWVLETACVEVSAWCEPGELPPTLCVNVSTQQICREFSVQLERVLELTEFPAERLELEITESVLIQSAERALECLAEWKRLGVRIAVDDFGTGYSSLSYLSRLPVDRLKVDKSLVHSMTTVPRDAAIVRTVISLGRELGFTVIAEGVETAAQFEMLCDLGCPQVQGYLTARPAGATEARALLKTNWGQRLDTRLRRLRETAGIRHVQRAATGASNEIN